MTEDEKIILRTMHDLACRQLGPLLAQAGSEGGGKIAMQLAAMDQLVAKLAAPTETNGVKELPPKAAKKFPRVVESPKSDRTE